MGRITVMRYPVLEVLRVVDGDTFDLHLDLGLRQYGHYRIRLASVDTPEVYGRNATEAGHEAKGFVEQWFATASDVWVETQVEDSFGRWVAEVVDVSTFDRLSEALLEAGLAEPYEKR